MKAFLFLLALTLLFHCEADVGSLRTLQTLGRVVRFELIDGVTQKKISDLWNNAVINVPAISGTSQPSLNVRAVLSGGAAVVVFDYQNTSKYHNDATSPYTLCASAFCPVLNYGKHYIRATTYSSTSLTGTPGKSFGITFEIRQTIPPVLPVTNLQLMNANVSPSKVLLNLTFGTTNVIDLGKLGLSDAKFNVQAVTSSIVQSVQFSNGVVETSKPLAYCGNSGETFNVCPDLLVGATKNITVTGYSSTGATGTAYPLQWAVIQIVNSSPVVAKPPTKAPTKAPLAAPTTSACAIPKVRQIMGVTSLHF